VKKQVSLLLIVLSVFFLTAAGYFLWERYTPARLAFNLKNTPQTQSSLGPHQPTRLKISDIKVDLPIFPAKIRSGNWEATTQGVSYLASTPIPGEPGNSVIYGHDYLSLLGNLTKLGQGASIQIVYADGSHRNFAVVSRLVVSPSQTEILNNTADTRLTIYTCTGFFDSQRLVLTAVPI